MIKQLEIRFLKKCRRARFLCFLIISLGFSTSANSQIYASHEENFAFKVKQIDEFFERFNDEGTLIKEYLSERYNSPAVSREDLLLSLFDRSNTEIKKEDVERFIRQVNDSLNPLRLSFYDDNWYARVRCSVVYEEEERALSLLLRVQKEKEGSSKWVVHRVYADFLRTPEEDNPNASLSPVSHATDFMGLYRAFEDTENLKAYLSSGFQDDQLSKLALEMQQKRITFRQVESLSYHFLQVDGWIFTVENFHRQQKNAGWLISELFQADAREKEAYMKDLLIQKL